MLIPSTTMLSPRGCAVPPALYAQVIMWDECAFWGVRRGAVAGYPQYNAWTKPERDMLVRYLLEAQSEIEQETAYPLLARWVADENRPYRFPLLARWGRVIAGGIEGNTVIEADAVVTHNADIAGVAQPSTVVVTTAVAESEIRVYYPASLGVEGPVEISPSDVDLDAVAGTATISVPRCRLVHPARVDNPDTGMDYDDVTNFLSVVDVYRVYNDVSTNATLVWPHKCDDGSNCCLTCGEYTQAACIYVRAGRLGAVDVLPASYAASTGWTRVSSCRCGEPERVALNYYAGLTTPTRQVQDAVIRLAHAKMPQSPCGGGRAQEAWKRDRNVPDVMTESRANCPFGLSDGSWTAWQFARASKLVRGSTLGGRVR